MEKEDNNSNNSTTAVTAEHGDAKNSNSNINSNYSDKTYEKTFRSVLPHEPLPIERDSSNGYVHLHGAFEPKLRKTTKDASSSKTTATVTTSQASFWKSARNLEETLLKAFRDNHEHLGLPFPALTVCVIDRNNLSRLRLEYSGPYEALQIQHAFRDRKISPQDILQTFSADRNNSISDGENLPTFGGRACQATMITTKPLPEDAATFWPRSNPPQFRRLLHDRGDDALERTQTRFVYVTGLVDNDKNDGAFSGTRIPDWWNQPYAVLTSMRKIFGTDVEIFLPKRQKGKQETIQSCHVGFRSAKDAQENLRNLQGARVTWECENAQGAVVQSGQLFLDYATITKKSKLKQKGEYEKTGGEASRSECTSVTSDVHVPGLMVLEDFLTEEEERILMAVLTGPQAPWAPQQSNKSRTGAVKRLVQHYGYVFDYQTADVLRREAGEDGKTPSAANCPPMPVLENSSNNSITASADVDDLIREGRGWEVLAKIVERTRQYDFGKENCDEAGNSNVRTNENKDDAQKQTQRAEETMFFPDLNQMTVNQYKPGEGIGSHVDTPSAFGDGLISISLNSGIVMEFTKVATAAATDANNGTAAANSRKLVYLPRRSLVLMTGPSRYEWEHQIVTRRTDTHNGVVLPRGLRISLTLRTALSTSGDPLPRYESDVFPPVWGAGNATDGKTANVLVTPRTERDHVHAVYDAIATQWHHTRGKRGILWPSATQFVQNLPAGSIVADVGCGDGKYFPAIWEAGSYVIGTDISLPLLQTSFASAANKEGQSVVPESRKVSPHRRALQQRPAVAIADCMSVPLRDNSCDAAICIAVMHHLSTSDRRIRCIEELVRIVVPRGRIHVQAWAMEQASDSKRRFAATDVFVPFNAQPKYLDRVTTESKSEPPTQKSSNSTKESKDTSVALPSKSVAELYSEAYEMTDFDERKGLVVFQRYCHMYREGELDDLVRQVPGVEIIESGYESGNHYVILEVVANATL